MEYCVCGNKLQLSRLHFDTSFDDPEGNTGVSNLVFHAVNQYGYIRAKNTGVKGGGAYA